MNRLPEVTKNLLAINILMFLATIVMEKQGMNLTNILGLHFFKAADFAPYQFVTYMFMHGGITHLFFNMFALYMFGGVLERVWGAKRFLIYYLVAGIGAGLLQELVQYVSFVQEGLANSQVATLAYGTGVKIETDYNGIGKIQYILGKAGVTIQKSEYTDVVTLDVFLLQEQKESVLKEITEATAGKSKFEDLGSRYELLL